MRLPAFNKSMAMMILALLAGLGAAWAARQHIQGRVQLLEAQARVPTVQRIVAAHDLLAGTRLRSEHLAVRAFPTAAASSDSIPPERHQELTDAVLRSTLRAGDLVLPVHAAKYEHVAFSSHLSAGRRAITMPVDAINSVSGLLQPGDLIDLYVSFEYQRRRITAPLLQGVLVLATGATTQYADDAQHDRTGSFATVTLDAAPEDAVKLVAARQSGIITAVLRPAHDSEPTQKAVRGDLASLLGVSRPVSPPTRKATVIYGNKSVRSVPRLKSAVGASQASGVFDLPYAPELVSAWMRSAAQSQLIRDFMDGAAQSGAADHTSEPEEVLSP